MVTLGILIDEEGFPKQSHIFEGNISDKKSFKEVLDKFKKSTKQGRLPFIMDAGISTEDNLTLLKSAGHDYIVVSSKKPIDNHPEEGFVIVRHTHQGKVEARIIREGDESILFCKSELKVKKELSMRSRFADRLEKDLEHAKASLKKKRGTKKYAKVLERIGRLKQKHARIAYLYDITITEDEGIVTDIKWKIKDEKRLDDRFSGSYYLRTSRTELSEKEIWNLYVSLTDVEDSFRSMKSYLGLRPNFHQKDERIKGHLFISVLAHHVVNSIQTLLHKSGIYLQWKTIRENLSVQHRVTTDKGKVIRLRNTSDPESFHYMIADTLSIKAKPLYNKRLKT